MRYLPLLIKIYLIGMLLQFFVQTFVTYRLGIDLQYIWAWKEVALILFLVLLLRQYWTARKKGEGTGRNGKKQEETGIKRKENETCHPEQSGVISKRGLSGACRMDRRIYKTVTSYLKSSSIIDVSTSANENDNTLASAQHDKLVNSRTSLISFLRADKTIMIMQLVFVVSVFLCFLISVGYHDQSLGTFILAFKYDFLGFFIFFLFVHIGGLLAPKTRIQVLQRYVQVMKRCLILALVWRCIIWVKPGTLAVLFGYSRDATEGALGIAPPAVYWTNLREGYVRNQFLFERPITRGFRLTSFRPLFYVFVLAKKNLQQTWGWWTVYMLNVGLTFSRAAWLSWLVLTAILLFLTYKKYRKKMILTAGALLVMGGGVALFLGDSVWQRQYSTTGHTNSIVEGRQRRVSAPFFGQGAGTSGPGSHQLAVQRNDPSLKFNPENQYLQILDEFGIVGGLGWFFLFGWLILCGRKSFLWMRRNENWKLKIGELNENHDSSFGANAKNPLKLQVRKENREILRCHLGGRDHLIVLVFALGMLGLAISGLVLHSFVDRMIVYPMMLLYGLIFLSSARYPK